MRLLFSFLVVFFVSLAPLVGVSAQAPLDLIIESDGKTTVFTRAQVEALGTETLVTETPWTEGEQTFVGVPLDRLLAAAEAEGSTIRAIAHNDYAATFSRAMASELGAFLATQHNGRPMRLRDKGPFWIVFDYSAVPELRQAEVRNMSVWQVKSISAE